MFKKLLLPAITALLTFCSLFLAAQQTPDTVVTTYNQSLPGSSWQYSFVQITDIHIGEEAPGDDYGTPGYDDNTSPSDAGNPLLRLRNSVQWINQHLDDLKIHFVIVTGDLSESAEMSELLRCKQLLDSLNVPYIPMIGNHDIWPLSQGTEAPLPSGDSLFNVLFADAFAEAQTFFPAWNNGTRLTKTWDTENSCYAWFQNYHFQYGSYTYIFTDFVSRAHDIALFNGASADAQLHDFTGGTWPWLQQTITNPPNQGQENILLFAHHPLSKSLLSGSFASFSYDEYDDITQYLNTQKDRVGTWIAGHKHNVDEYDIKTWTFSSAIATGYEAAANWEYTNGHFRIFKVYDTLAPIPAGLNLQPTNKLTLSPNPCPETLHVQWEKDLHSEYIDVFNMQGISVFHFPLTPDQTSLTIDLRKLPSGLYLIYIDGVLPAQALILH